MALQGPKGRSRLEEESLSRDGVLAGQQMSGEPLRPAKSLKSKFPPNSPDAADLCRLSLTTMTEYQARPR